jgi:high-affinity iron transporter
VLGSFLIFLREGIEGSMIVSIMCAYLAAAGRRDLFRGVFLGVGAALIASGLGAVALYVAIKDSFIGSTAQTWFETGTFVLAVIVLTYMTFWMKRNARHMSATLKSHVTAAVTGGSAFALAMLAFVTVGREAVETVIFLLAISFQSSPLQLLAGALVGLAISLAISIAIYRLGVRMNLRRFFTIVGAALMLVAAGLLANAVQNLQELHVLPGAGYGLWSTERIIAEDSTLGDILHGLIGYAAAPTALQVISWALFLGFGLLFFLRNPAPGKQAQAVIVARKS